MSFWFSSLRAGLLNGRAKLLLSREWKNTLKNRLGRSLALPIAGFKKRERQVSLWSRTTMTKPKNVQQEEIEPLNLEALSLDELDRSPFCESDAAQEPENIPSTLKGPHSSHRCRSSERELLKNQFPPDD